MNKAVFLDRDGTINVDKHYLYRIDEFEFIPGVLEGLKLLFEHEFKLILITNQSGIARGFFTERDYKLLEDWLEAALRENGSPLTASYYCPHLPDAKIEEYRRDCDCRKPKTGLYERAVNDWNIDLRQSFVVGDRLRDSSICRFSGCSGFLVGTTETVDIIERVKNGAVKNVHYANNLFDACMNIVNRDCAR